MDKYVEQEYYLESPGTLVDRPVNRLYPLETNFKFVLKDSEQNKVQEVMKEGICRPKREAAELAKVRMRYAPGINRRGVSVKYRVNYLAIRTRNN